MRRRSFINKSVVGLTTVFLPSLIYSCNSGTEYNVSDLARPSDLAQIWDLELIQQIGEAYLQKFPAETKESALIKKLKVSGGDSKEDLTILAQMIEDDFKSSRTVLLEGWILSLTEARQCALFSLNLQK